MPLWFRQLHPAASLNEWIVYHDLTARRGFKERVDFFYQRHIPAPGYGLKNEFRSDFWILPGGRGGSPGGQFSRGYIFDPYNTYTHPTPALDRLRRAILAQSYFLLIWMYETQLQADPHGVVGLGLRGVDTSPLARGW